MLISIRGATTVTENNKELVLQATSELLCEIIDINNLCLTDIISVFFSCTRDLDKVYPAVAARGIGLTQAALMCFDELYVENSLPLCIRVMINANSNLPQSEVKHIYRENAKSLRPDISEGNKKYFSIAIDGPSGAGKSTVARLCAKKLGFSYIDTGAMYRAFAYFCDKNGIDVANSEEVNEAVKKADIEVKFIDGVQRVFSQHEDVTEKIRTQQTAESTSKVSTIASVREMLVKMQRELASSCNVIMDGRDIGSVVLKDSALKIYLNASKHLRARRRFEELKGAGRDAEYYSILADIEKRDFRDMNRAVDPLVKCDDAVLIDSDNLSAEEVSVIICALARQRLNY